MALTFSAWGLGFLICIAVFFVWLFYKGYQAYQRNGWDDPFFNHDDYGGNVGGF